MFRSEKKLKINLNETLNNGIMYDKYSKYAEEKFLVEGIPYVSFPFTVHDLHDKAKYLAWVLIDHDSYPLIHFSWIHWVVANYEVNSKNINIDENISSTAKLITGTNSFASPLANIKNKKITMGYGGPTPPDKNHTYTFYVYALSDKLKLGNGFMINDFYDQLELAKIEECSIKFIARK